MLACPDCGSHSHHKVGSANRPDRFRCKDCGREWTQRNHRPQKKHRLLSIDIETLPGKYYAFSPWNQNLGRHMMIEDWSLLSYSAKWVGDNKIISSVLTPEEVAIRDDRRLAFEIWHLLNKANVVITHNGKRFDIKKINARLWKHKLTKPSSYKVIDTLVEAKKVFGLTYNTMDFIAEFVERDRKLDTEKGLWVRADHGDPDALREMLEYNEQDVRTQEQIYMEMRPWMDNHPNLTLYFKHDEGACPVCLHRGHKKIGYHFTNKKKYPEFRCDHCGAVWHSSKAVK
jgi:DNA polymerase III epsilon subunit-like protein